MAASIGGIDRRQLLKMLGAAGLAALGTTQGVSLSYAADTRTLRAAITNYTVVNFLDPGFSNSIAESMILWGIFDTLVKFDVGMKIVPDLAELWTTPDSKTWVFKLRRGVKFHDGSEMTSEDVKFSFDRVRAEGSNSPFRTYFTSVAQIEAVDPYTVKFVTKEPFAPFLPFLTNTRTGAQIVPRKAVEAAGKGFGQKPIGTGAFKFVDLIPGQKVILEANKQYFVSGQPKLDRVEISLIEQETSVVSAILAGDIDLSNSAPYADVAALQKNPAIRVYREVGLNLRFVELNNMIPPFDDVHFRRATSMAFDREALVQIVVFGEGQIANGPVPPSLKWAFDTNQHEVNRFNPDAARAELEKSRYKKGTQATVLTFGSSWWKRWAEIMVEQVNDTLGQSSPSKSSIPTA